MPYRVVLAFLLIIALALTLNERRQDEQAREYAAALTRPPADTSASGGVAAGRRTMPSLGGAARLADPVGNDARGDTRWSPYPFPTMPPEAPSSAVTSGGAGYPGPAIERPPTEIHAPRGAFVPRRVRVRHDLDLRQSPTETSRPAEPVPRVPAGVLVEALEEHDGWYLVEAAVARGWAPANAFADP